MTDEKDPPRERYTFRAKAEINASYGKVRPPELVGRRVTDEEFVEILKRGIVTYTSMKVADVGRMIGEIGDAGEGSLPRSLLHAHRDGGRGSSPSPARDRARHASGSARSEDRETPMNNPSPSSVEGMR